MATPSYSRSLVCAAKRLRISPPSTSSQPHQLRSLATHTRPSEETQNEIDQIRMPRAVQATYMLPLKRETTHNIPSCNLQLRSYSVRNLEVFADFALRAAYFLNLPASGPIPLPKITERWTVPRSVFIFKKSQENFERITLRRLIQIKDGHPDTVNIWLAFLRKYHYYGVGMKANVFEHGGLETGKEMDENAAQLEEKLSKELEKLAGGLEGGAKSKNVQKMLETEPFKAQYGAYGPMSANQEVAKASKRIGSRQVRAGSGSEMKQEAKGSVE